MNVAMVYDWVLYLWLIMYFIRIQLFRYLTFFISRIRSHLICLIKRYLFDNLLGTKIVKEIWTSGAPAVSRVTIISMFGRLVSVANSNLQNLIVTFFDATKKCEACEGYYRCFISDKKLRMLLGLSKESLINNQLNSCSKPFVFIIIEWLSSRCYPKSKQDRFASVSVLVT